MNNPKDNMTNALKTAQEAWTNAFFKDGYGRSFDKYTVTPDPAAIAIVAAVIYLKEVLTK